MIFVWVYICNISKFKKKNIKNISKNVTKNVLKCEEKNIYINPGVLLNQCKKKVKLQKKK